MGAETAASRIKSGSQGNREVLRCVLDEGGEIGRDGDTHDEVHELTAPESVQQRRRDDDPVCTTLRSVRCERQRHVEALGGYSDKDRGFAPALCDDGLDDLHPLLRGEFSDLPGESQAEQTVRAGIQRETGDGAQAADVDGPFVVKRRAE